MVRTSVILSDSLHQRLILSARAEEKNVSELIRDILEQALVRKEEAQADRVYSALNSVRAIGKGEETEDISGNIDQILYGDHGAWQGRDQ